MLCFYAPKGKHRGEAGNVWELRRHGASSGLSKEKRKLAGAVHPGSGGV